MSENVNKEDLSSILEP